MIISLTVNLTQDGWEESLTEGPSGQAGLWVGMSGGQGCLDCLNGCGTTGPEIEEHRSLVSLWSLVSLNHVRGEQAG